MVKIHLVCVFAFCLTFSFAQTYRWPTDYSGPYPKIGFNYGVNEEAGIASDFHQGIDIKCISGQELIYAVEDGKIIKLQMGNDQTQIVIYFQTTTGKIFGYGHCIEAATGINLYSGNQPNSNNFISTPSGLISKGTTIATTSSSLASGSTIGYEHCHFFYYDCSINNTAADEHLIRNPLTLNYVNASGNAILTTKDPDASTGNPNDAKPRLGPLRIMKKFNGATTQPNITYLNCLSEPFVYGEVDFTKEATDDLGYISNSAGGSDAFKWCNSVNPKTNGVRGVPYKIKYYLKNPTGTALTGVGDPSPQGEYIFNGAPLQSTVATNKLFLYDGGSGESINSLNPPASYNFI